MRGPIFSVSAPCLYELLTGTRAFTGDSMLESERGAARRARAAASPASGHRRSVPGKAPAERFQNMTEVREALEQIAAKPATNSSLPSQSSPSPT